MCEKFGKIGPHGPLPLTQLDTRSMGNTARATYTYIDIIPTFFPTVAHLGGVYVRHLMSLMSEWRGEITELQTSSYVKFSWSKLERRARFRLKKPGAKNVFQHFECFFLPEVDFFDA